MWKPWNTVTEDERKEIDRIAEQFGTSKRAIANMYQGGTSFVDIIEKLKREGVSEWMQE